MKRASKVLNILIIICIFLIVGLIDWDSATPNARLIATPLFDFFDQFKSNGIDYTNIFNL